MKLPWNSKIGLKQLFDEDSHTYTYLIWDTETRDAILVDPVDIEATRDVDEVKSLGLNLRYAVNTHAHADHLTGTHLLKTKLPETKSVISKDSGAQADIKVQNGDKISFGQHHVQVRATPGHTNGCVSYVADDMSFVLTGDALLIHGCGRTDFQQGDPAKLFDSIHSQLYTLPDETVVFPGHDYKGRPWSTIGIEKQTNPRLGSDKTKEEFVDIMKNLNLALPKHIDVAIPANMRDGAIAV